MSQRSVREIHLPQSLNEEASADEFSEWEQVSSLAAERFVHRHMASPGSPSFASVPLAKKRKRQRPRSSRHLRPSIFKTSNRISPILRIRNLRVHLRLLCFSILEELGSHLRE